MTMSGNQKIFGIISVVCGGVAVFMACFTSTIFMGVFGMAAGIAGIVLSSIAKKGFAAAGETSPLPKIGLILSIVGLVLCTIFTISCAICYCTASSVVDKIENDPSFASQFGSAVSDAFSSARQ